jgi:uncharacterized protein
VTIEPPSPRSADALAHPRGHPWLPDVHCFSNGSRALLFLVDQGAIFELEAPLAAALQPALEHRDRARVDHLLAGARLQPVPWPEEPTPVAVPCRAISLAVAEKCNLGCTYCYAEQGSFGGAARNMSLEIAQASIDRLLHDVEPGGKVSLTFLGGEPLANAKTLRMATAYAAEKAAARGITVAFSLTTNGTLLTPEDFAFFDHYRFCVTVSLDGVGDTHDALRPYKSGRGSYADIIARLEPWLRSPARRCEVRARVTVTPRNLCLSETLAALVELGFGSIQFSPLLFAPSGEHEMGAADLTLLLEQMIACGEVFERQLYEDRWIPWANAVSTLQKIHRYRREAYPCGAGGGYLGVSADGSLYACHRFVNDEAGRMGHVDTGVDADRQSAWLAARNVHRQEPCRECWARYLCSGGCHHEAIHRGRPACDYIRGWLDFCLGMYARLLERSPRLLGRILQEPAG